MAGSYPLSTPDPYRTKDLAGKRTLDLLNEPESPPHREDRLLNTIRTYSEVIANAHGRPLELMDEEKSLNALTDLFNRGGDFAIIAELLLSMVACGNSTAKALLEAANLTQTCNQRLRQLEFSNARNESYICSKSIDIKWPFQCSDSIKTDCIESVMYKANLPMWHIMAIHHTDMDLQQTNKTVVTLSSQIIADKVKRYINGNPTAPFNPIANTSGKKKTLVIKASNTAFTGSTYETIVKTAVANILPRLGMCSGGDIYIDSSFRDGRVVDATGHLLLWVCVTHEEESTVIEIFAPTSIHDRVAKHIERTVTEILNNRDELQENGTDFNSIYMRFAKEVSAAQIAADE